MSKPMRLWLINPAKEEIVPWLYHGDFDTIAPALLCELVQAVTINHHNDDIFVDEEGWCKPQAHAFMVSTYPQPLAGRGLVTGTSLSGNIIEPKVTLEWLKANVRFFHAPIH